MLWQPYLQALVISLGFDCFSQTILQAFLFQLLQIVREDDTAPAGLTAKYSYELLQQSTLMNSGCHGHYWELFPFMVNYKAEM